MVGAAGFEPTTCSTQNCRATRLRYTPICWETMSLHASGRPSKSLRAFPLFAESMAVKERMRNPVAARDAVLFRSPSDHLEHSFGRAA